MNTNMNRSPPAVPPPSLANLLLLEEANPSPSPCITTTNTKSYKYGLIDALLHHAKHLLSRRVHDLRLLWKNKTWFLTKITRMIKGEPEWGDLPPELWREIGLRLPSRIDILRFRSVCDQFRKSLPYPTLFPLRVPPLPLSSNCSHTSLFVTELSVYCIENEFESLCFEEVEQGGKFIGSIVDASRTKFPESKISLMTSCRYSRLYIAGKAHHLRRADEGRWAMAHNEYAPRVVIISSEDGGVNLSVVVHLRRGPMEGRLALLRLTRAPENWVWDTDFCDRVFDTIGTYRGRLCGLDSKGRLFVMDYESLEMNQVHVPCPEGYKRKDGSFLFEYCEELYYAAFGDEDESPVGYRLRSRFKKWTQIDIDDGPSYALLPLLLDSPHAYDSLNT